MKNMVQIESDRNLKFLNHFRESYLKKHQVSHQTHESGKPIPSDNNENLIKPASETTSNINSNFHRRFGLTALDIERERRRFHTFSEFYLQHQRSAFQYVCHQQQNYRYEARIL